MRNLGINRKRIAAAIVPVVVAAGMLAPVAGASTTSTDAASGSSLQMQVPDVRTSVQATSQQMDVGQKPSVADMFEMQMRANYLARLSETVTAIIASQEQAISSAARAASK